MLGLVSVRFPLLTSLPLSFSSMFLIMQLNPPSSPTNPSRTMSGDLTSADGGEDKVTKVVDLITMLPTDSDVPALRLLKEEEFGKQCTGVEPVTHDLVEDVKADEKFSKCSGIVKLLREHHVKWFDDLVKYLEDISEQVSSALAAWPPDEGGKHVSEIYEALMQKLTIDSGNFDRPPFDLGRVER